ncbi:MAG: hypothetical protein CMB80_25505 [Flammeovirgaceae bacterium]|nr:hypothetical protein [Flammeovirgaceae bacterium]MBE61759.1 hypothetical protein [Flammeovirgaceae bacterium]
MNRQLFFIIILLVATKLVAQTDQFIYYDLSDAVDNEVIKGVVKDSQGFMWFATDQGVLQYDGRTTELYNEGLQSDYTKNFLNTSDNRLIVINDYGIKEIITKDSTTFIPFELGEYTYDDNFSFPKSIYQDRQGNIWLGEINALVRINQEGMKRFVLGSDFQSISYHRTFTFKEDAFGTLWIAPFKGKLLKYNSAADSILEVDVDLPITEVTGMSVLRGDYLLIGGKEGLFEIKVDSNQEILETRLYSNITNISALQSARNILFVGTWDKGLMMLDFEERTFHEVEEVDFNDVVDFYYDATVPEVWVVGSENVGLISFSVIHSFQSVGRSRIESVTTLDDEIFYSIGQELRSVDWSDQLPSENLVYSKTDYFDRIQANDEGIWIGSSFGTIMKYGFDEKRLFTVADSTGASVKYISIDKEGNKWFAGDRHILRIPFGKMEIAEYPIVSSNIVKQDLDGDIYVGCWGEVNFLKYNAGKDQFEELPLTLDFDLDGQLSIEDMAFDESGNIWMATNQGLLKGANSDFKRISVPGIPENAALKAIVIQNEIVWISGDFGLTAYNQENALTFNTKNGLPSKLLNWRGLMSYKEGVLISSAKGLVMAKSDLVKFEKTPTPVLLTITSEEKHLTDDQNLMIPYKGSLEVEYTTLTYPGRQVEYQSRLVGLNDQWSESTTNRQVSYLGFSEGSYQLEVRSREIGALWSDPVVLSFTVPKPWFFTWWAYLLAGSLSIVLIAGVVRVYNYSLILQKRRFRKIIEDRTKQINEQKNEIIAQKNRIIEQKEELLAKTEAVHKSQQALSDADVNFLHLKEKQLRDQIEYRDKQITTQSLNLIQKNETLKSLKERLEDLSKPSKKSTPQDLRKVLKLIDESFRHDKDWEDFKLYFEQIYTGFYAKLKVNCPALTTQELRHCALIRLNLSVNECASILGISPDSVKVSRSRIRKKIDLEGKEGLTDFILSI